MTNSTKQTTDTQLRVGCLFKGYIGEMYVSIAMRW